MPSSITHELIADEARRRAVKEAQEAIGRAPDYFYLGAQGPDLFFFLKPLSKKEYNFGKTLHRGKVFEWFSALAEAVSAREGEERDRCLSYALGFCSHLSADVAFHPFVYRYLEETNAPHRTHQIMENDWDVYFLQKFRGGSVYRHPYPFDLKKIAREGTLYRLMKETMPRLGRKPVSAGAFRRMLKLFRFYLKEFHRKRMQWLRLIGLGSLYPRKTPNEEFLGGDRFSDRAGGRGANADALFFAAVEGSIARIDAFVKAAETKTPLVRELYARHLLTGAPL